MPVLGWGKPLGYDEGVITALHAVMWIADGRFVTACWGSWLASDFWELFTAHARDVAPTLPSLDVLVQRRCYRVCRECERGLELGTAPRQLEAA